MGQVEDHMANSIVAQLLFLESENPDGIFTLHKFSWRRGNSWFGNLRYHVQFIKPQVSTVCIGQAASMGAILLTGGAAGKTLLFA